MIRGAEIHLSGTSQAQLGEVARSLYADLSGTSRLEAVGNVDSVEIGASGTAKADMFDLQAARARVTLSGASHVNLHVTQSLRGTISGVSQVVYSGAPDVSVSRTLTSQVRPR